MRTAPIRCADPIGDAACAGPAPSATAAPRADAVLQSGIEWRRRWAGRDDFTVLVTGFALGWDFVALWQAWRDDPRRPARLDVVAVDPHPPTREALRHAHRDSPWPALSAALVDAWPLPTPNLHPVDFDDGRVALLLAWGDPRALLPQLTLRADAVRLGVGLPAPMSQTQGSDRGSARAVAACRRAAGGARRGHADADTLPLLKAIAGRCADGATIDAARGDDALRRALRTAGFDADAAGSTTGAGDDRRGVFAPRPTQRRAGVRGDLRVAAHGSADPDRCDAIVVGAGIAGAAVARELARTGRRVTVLDRHPAPAAEASGHPVGLFHATVHDGDGPHARLLRAATLWAARVYREARDGAGVPAGLDGLLRLEPPGSDVAALHARLARSGLPLALVDAVAAPAAAALAGLALQRPAWHHRVGGWVAPAAWVAHALATPGIAWRGGAAVAGFERRGGLWVVVDRDGGLLAQAPVLVLAHGAAAAAAMTRAGHAAWPLSGSRGQLAHGPAPAGTALALPLAGDGYVVPFDGADGRPHWLCGATREPLPRGDDGLGGGRRFDADASDGDDAPPLRDDDHRVNLERLARLTGCVVAPDAPGWQRRAAWRLHSADRLPVAGPVPAAGVPGRPTRAGPADTALAHWPREPGLHVLTALGARGLTLAPLLGRAVAAAITGTPSPLERDLLDAVDPARWLQRARRRPGAGAAAAPQASPSCRVQAGTAPGPPV